MQPKPILPPRLTPGARVALVAPSGPVPEGDSQSRAEANCALLGLEPVVMPSSGNRWGYLAGTDDERASDLNCALTDPDIDAVWCLRGGSGLNRIVDRIDFAAFARHPKVVLGYSDITVLLLALWTKAGVVTFHGPVARAPMGPFVQSHLDRMLFRAAAAGTLEYDTEMPPDVAEPIVTITPGIARGRLIGGNLSLLQALAGTEYFPDLDGAILFLEDVHEAVYRIDRMLAQLRLSGALRRLAGVIIGRITEIPRQAGDDAFGLAGLWQEYFGSLGIPVASGFPIGHIDSQWTLPIGVMAELDATNRRVTVLERAVA
jgi:muramoyltetrapeptide carboxypeptidase